MPHPGLARSVGALIVAVALFLAAMPAPLTARAQSAEQQVADDRPTQASLTAPEGGPVDDGWLDAINTAFTQFDDEPPPGGEPIWPGVRQDVRTTTVGDGLAVDVQILNLDPQAAVTVQPTLAGGTVPGLAPVSVQSGDPLQGRVAAINGAFWLDEPVGEPNGLFVRNRRLISNAESQGVGPRGAVAWTADGRLVIDRVESTQIVTLPDTTRLQVGGINRGHREFDEPFPDGVNSMLAYTSDYGVPVVVTHPTRPGDGDDPTATEQPSVPDVSLAVLGVTANAWPASGRATATVDWISRDTPGGFTPQPDQVVIVATGTRADALADLRVGDTVGLATRIRALDPARNPLWAQVTRALAGGPMIVKESRMTDPQDWIDEGFEPQIHSDVRAPRSAIGVTEDGRTLMVTADGRRPGITHGFTIAELADYMIALGAVEALSLDGGGSSQLVVDGILQNHPCCDDDVRAVADSLQIVHGEPFDGTIRLRGRGRVETAVSVARQAYPDGVDHAILAVADSFPDALAGGPLAGVMDSPLLLTGRQGLPNATRQALQDLGVRRVTLLGGRSVIGDAVVDALHDDDIRTLRVGGKSRFDTAAAIAELLKRRVAGAGNPTVTRAFVTAGDTFADALVAAGPGGILGMPVVLTQPDDLHPATAAVLEDLEEVVLVGGRTRLSAPLEQHLVDQGLAVTRLAGSNRFATARAVNDWLAAQADLSAGLVVATGGDFPDALAGGPMAANLRAPLMIVPEGSIDADADAASFFDQLPPRDQIHVLGGLKAISSFQQWQLEQLTLTASQ